MKAVFKNGPSGQEIQSAKNAFLGMIRKGKLFHATSEENAPRIESNGLKAPAYLSFGEPSWDGEVVFVVQGKDVPEIYPDPEHLLDLEGGYLDGVETPISFETVTRKIDPDMLYWMYFAQAKQEGWPANRITNGFWLISPKPIGKEKISREE